LGVAVAVAVAVGVGVPLGVTVGVGVGVDVGGPTDSPDRFATGLPLAALLTLSDADLNPGVTDLNVTLNMQVAAGARVAPQPLDEIVKLDALIPETA